MAEGLSATEVGKGISEHAETQAHSGTGSRRDQVVSIAEAVLLSIVTIVAAWSGYSAAKWQTESSLHLAKATATRTKANRAFQEALIFRVGDATTFNAWFTARVAGNSEGTRVARDRFRPAYRVAFNAWLATHPFTNPNAPAGPQAMPQYKPAGAVLAKQLDAVADADYADGQHAAKTADNYIRTTVILASVLFLVGISSHFHIRSVRLGLITVGAGLLVFAAVLILQLPAPP